METRYTEQSEVIKQNEVIEQKPTIEDVPGLHEKSLKNAEGREKEKYPNVVVTRSGRSYIET